MDQTSPAVAHEVTAYLPYIQGNKRNFLPWAITLYQKGFIDGERKIEGSENIPFTARWNIGTLPTDLTCCSVKFHAPGEFAYEVTMTGFEFVDFLIQVIENYKRNRIVDFSKAFYRKLLCPE
jgi:hypothetical protein